MKFSADYCCTTQAMRSDLFAVLSDQRPGCALHRDTPDVYAKSWSYETALTEPHFRRERGNTFFYGTFLSCANFQAEHRCHAWSCCLKWLLWYREQTAAENCFRIVPQAKYNRASIGLSLYRGESQRWGNSLKLLNYMDQHSTAADCKSCRVPFRGRLIEELFQLK